MENGLTWEKAPGRGRMREKKRGSEREGGEGGEGEREREGGIRLAEASGQWGVQRGPTLQFFCFIPNSSLVREPFFKKTLKNLSEVVHPLAGFTYYFF